MLAAETFFVKTDAAMTVVSRARESFYDREGSQPSRFATYTLVRRCNGFEATR